MKVRVAGILLLLLLAGCAVLPLWVANNDPMPARTPTRARAALTETDFSKGVFVGIAISGGGMRAANFSAATLLELEALGFLRQASAISAVSGGSLTAGYFGLFGPVNGDPATAVADRWSAAAVKERFLVDLQTHWILRWFNPWNAVRYWTTGFDRSDIMKHVFNVYVLGSTGKQQPTFADMRAGRPKILINATSLPGVGRFVFTDEALEHLGSRLDSYPLSDAIMASGAFPGAFHNVTLRNYREDGQYQHLFDGGATDNLGADALLDLLDRASVKPRGCFLFVVDAYPYDRNRGLRKFDTRSVVDFVVDHNLSDSASVFLTVARRRTLHRIGLLPAKLPGELPQWDYQRDGYRCRVWHLTFESFFVRPDPTEQELRKELENLREAGRVPTRYRLEGGTRTDGEIQKVLFDAARYLVRRDGQTLKETCDWFVAQGFPPCVNQ